MWFFGGFCFIVCLCFKELVQNPSAWFPMQPPSLVGPSYMTCSGAVAEKQKLFPSPGCPALLLGATFSLVSFLMSLALTVPGEQGPRNAVCVTAAAAAEACPGQPPPTPVARESPGAMGEAGWKWEMLRSGHILCRAALLGVRREHPNCMFPLGTACWAASWLQLSGCSVMLALFQANDLQIFGGPTCLEWPGQSLLIGVSEVPACFLICRDLHSSASSWECWFVTGCVCCSPLNLSAL